MTFSPSRPFDSFSLTRPRGRAKSSRSGRIARVFTRVFTRVIIRLFTRVFTRVIVPVVLSFPHPAVANGRFPAASQLALSESGNVLLLRTTFGLVVSRDRGASWDWICESAVGYGGVEDPPVAVLGEQHFFAGLFRGLAVSHDGGVRWAPAEGPVGTVPVVDVARPSGGRTLVLTAGAAAATDGGEDRFATRLFETVDFGASFHSVGPPLDPTLRPETVDVSPSDPRRVYVSGTRRTADGPALVLLVSSNGGRTFDARTVDARTVDARTVPGGSAERSLYISALHPTDPNTVILRAGGRGPTRLLLTRNAGRTFVETFASKEPLLGCSLGENGLFFGGPSGGLFRSPPTLDAGAPEKVSTVSVQCLTSQGRTLYACSSEAFGFVVGASVDDGRSFVPAFRFAGMRGPLEGVRHSSGAGCADAWPGLKMQLGLDRDTDGGPVKPAAPEEARPRGRGCEWITACALLALAAAALVRRLRS